MIPPMHMIGVDTMKFSVMSTSICTCCTSFVLRVMRVAVPKPLISRALSESTLRKISRRRSRPTAMAVLAPKYTPPIAVSTWTRHTTSMVMPVDQMKSVSPVETPLSMIWALRLGR